MSRSKIFVVGGNFRGGTTAVAQLLIRMGINMGDELDPVGNCEDKEIQQIFSDSMEKRKMTPEFNDDMRDVLRKRSEQEGDWGFKFPAVHQFLPQLIEFFPMAANVHFIFVFRDPVAVSMSEYARTGGVDPVKMMQRTVHYNARMIAESTQLAKQGYEVFPVSFEHVLTRSEDVVDELLVFCGKVLNKGERKMLVDSIKLVESKESFGYGEEIQEQ